MNHPTAGVDDQRRLIRSLGNPALYGVTETRLIETHISYVILTGQYAYKIKKAVNLEFLDFTTLAARRFYCEQELRLNRRLAPTIYLDIVAITGAAENPEINGPGPVIEYAVRMREFPQEALLPQVLLRNELTNRHIDELAAKVAAFHALAAPLPANSLFGTPGDILELALQNFTQIEPLLEDAADRAELDELRRWTENEHVARATRFDERRRAGFVRECHGDLHLGNIALVNDEITIFDCIEFNDRMRWDDVMSDVAFLVMDLQDRRRPAFGSRFLNAYLESTGDYAGVQVLRFYTVYRAMVRAKVTRMRARQSTDLQVRTEQIREYRGYVKLAKQYARPPRPGLVITHGAAGSGKTTWTQELLELVGAIRIRTDVERKRRHGLPARSRSRSGLEAGLYTAAETENTYAHVRSLTAQILAGGYVAIVDGTFLHRWQRNLFKTLAAEQNVQFIIADFAASEATLRARVEKRQTTSLDASEADTTVLELQLKSAEVLASDEQLFAVTIDTEAHERGPEAWRPLLDRLGFRTVVS